MTLNPSLWRVFCCVIITQMYYLSKHAKERIKKRGIRPSDAIKTVFFGVWRRPLPPYGFTRVSRYKNIEVVFKRKKIITAYLVDQNGGRQNQK